MTVSLPSVNFMPMNKVRLLRSFVLTNSGRKRRQQVEGGRATEKRGVDVVDRCHAVDTRRPRHSVATESTHVRRVVRRRRR